MRTKGKLWRLGLWGAIMAVALTLFGSSFARAPASQKAGGDFVEVCTRHGKVLIDVSGKTPDPVPTKPSSAESADHCPLCVLRESPPVPAAQNPLPLEVVGASFAPLLFFSAPRPLFVWASPQPRAPPQSD